MADAKVIIPKGRVKKLRRAKKELLEMKLYPKGIPHKFRVEVARMHKDLGHCDLYRREYICYSCQRLDVNEQLE